MRQVVCNEYMDFMKNVTLHTTIANPADLKFSLGKKKLNIKIWKLFNTVFNCLPFAALIGNDIFCVHGGWGMDFKDWSDIEALLRPTDIPDTGLLCDMMWATPSERVGWGFDDPGGGTIQFGEDIVSTFVEKHGLKLVCRAHTVNLFFLTFYHF